MTPFVRNGFALGAGVVLHHLVGLRTPLSATIALTHRCNLRCRYCACYKRGIPEMSTDEVKRLIGSLHRLGTRKIGFTGGEPMLRRDIFELLDFAKEKGFITHLVTNASPLNESNVSLLRKLDVLFISYEGPVSVNNHVRAGTTDNVLDKIRLARRNGIKVCALTTIMRQNIPHLGFIMDRSNEEGFPVLFSPLHHHLYSAGDISDLEPDSSEFARAFETITGFKRRGFGVANSYSYLNLAARRPEAEVSKCYAGKLYLVIDANGDVYPCWPAMGSTRPLNFFKDGFENAITRTAPPKCDGCNFSCHHELNFMLSLRLDAVINLTKTWHRRPTRISHG